MEGVNKVGSGLTGSFADRGLALGLEALCSELLKLRDGVKVRNRVHAHCEREVVSVITAPVVVGVGVQVADQGNESVDLIVELDDAGAVGCFLVAC